MNNREARKTVNATLTHQERVSIALQAYGTQDVYFNLDTIAGATDLTKGQVYQALYRLAHNKQIEILTEPIGNTGRNRVCGVHLIKLEAAASILESVPTRTAAKPVSTPKSVKRAELRIQELAPTIIAYMDKKVVIDKVCAQLEEAGMDSSIVNFSIDSVCEEGILILNEWVNAQRANNELAVRCEAMEREIANLRGLKQPLPQMSSERQAEAVTA